MESTKIPYDTLIGFSFLDWIKLLRENKFAIENKSIAYQLTLMSIGTSFGKQREKLIFGKSIDQVEISSPIFIIGHWRSGTTFLHNMISRDKRFAYPNSFQTTHPHTFLVRERYLNRQITAIEKQKRPMDNIEVSHRSTSEDEPALAVLSLRSSLLGWVFPSRKKHYDRYLTFRDASEEDAQRWTDALELFSKKLTYKYKRPLIYKSPTHTSKIRLILSVFPKARFIHIYRNPYRVFLSTMNLMEKVLPLVSLQGDCKDGIRASVLRDYVRMYDSFFEDQSLILTDHYAEIAYEDLEKDPVREIAKLYGILNLPDFSEFQADLENYVNSLSNYKKNRYPLISDEDCHDISIAWKRNFDAWGYDVNRVELN